jgi:hypothetical protein
MKKIRLFLFLFNVRTLKLLLHPSIWPAVWRSENASLSKLNQHLPLPMLNPFLFIPAFQWGYTL